ncbi:MAG: amidohydrolase family protein, partial [Bryobacteraceae bacterium]
RHSIVVEGALIREIVPSDRVQAPPGAVRIDARGKFVMPGMIDYHFHFNTRSDPRHSPVLPFLFLANGVTTLREMGNWIAEENKVWVDSAKARGLPAPRLLTSGPAIDGRDTLLPTQSMVVLDAEDARRVANRLMDEGATSLKVYSRLPLSLLRVVVEEAHKRGVPVQAHLGVVDPRDAAAAGLDGISHTNNLIQALLPPREAEAFRQASLREPNPGSFESWSRVDPAGARASALIEIMRKHGVSLDPTVALHEPSADSREHESRRRAHHNMATFDVRFHRAGGKLVMGSHGMAPYAAPGFALLREIEVHVEHGLSPADALQAATRVPAESLRLKDRGVLAPGRLADIVVLDGDPLMDIRNLGKVSTVILGGVEVDRARLRAADARRTGEN